MNKFTVPGVISLNSLADWVNDEIHQGIDLGLESAVENLRAEYLEKHPDADEADIDEHVEKETEYWEFGDSEILIGDWIKIDGKYQVDRQGKQGFAAIYSNFCGDTVTVEWSKHTRRCAGTSPCFMVVGGGTCGNLDSKGSSHLAYDLPTDWYRGEQD